MRFTVSLMEPEPLAVQVPPPAGAQVHVQLSEGGKVSATVAALPFAASLDTVGFFTRTAREMQWLWEQIGFGR